MSFLVRSIHRPVLNLLFKPAIKLVFSWTGFFILLLIWSLMYIVSRSSTMGGLAGKVGFTDTQLSTVAVPATAEAPLRSGGPQAKHVNISFANLKHLYEDSREKLSQRGSPKTVKHFLASLSEQMGMAGHDLSPEKLLKRENVTSNGPFNLLPHCDGQNPLLLVLVLSSQKYYHRREAIRLSWGRSSNEINKYLFNGNESKRFTWRTIFAIGQPLDVEMRALMYLEHKLWGDLLVLNYSDHYNNLTNKTLLSVQWIASNQACETTYLLKTDDDCFVNHVQLLPWLSQLNPMYKYIGKYQGNMVIVRDPKSRYYVPTSVLKGRFYPAYCSGGGYVLKYDILQRLMKNSARIPRIRNEDAFMGMVFQTLNEKPLLDHRFLLYIYDHSVHVMSMDACKAKDAFVIHNIVGKGQLIYHWRAIVTQHFKFVCEKWTL